MKKWLIRIGGFLLFLIFIVAVYCWLQIRDRHPDYWLDISHVSSNTGPLQIGFAANDISPVVADTWTDVNSDARYVPEDGDQYEDLNGNGTFDPVWMAGFQNKRPAMGLHDPIWARAMVIDDGSFRLAWVVLDVIGYGNDDVIAIRKGISTEAGIDYAIVSSTHTHEGPDLLGMWGESEYKSGVDPSYRQTVIQESIAAIEQAVQNLHPAKVSFAQDLSGAVNLVTDSRLPEVKDPGLRVMVARSAETDSCLGSLICWANHPETLWNKNLLISSDFPHYIREGVEKGIYDGDSLMIAGLGGTAIFANGSIGGLMTTLPEFPIPAVFGDTLYTEPGFDKTEAQGLTVAKLVLEAVEADSSEALSQTQLMLRAKSLELDLANPLYRLAAVLGIFDRGMHGWWTIRSEIAWWKLGPASFLHHPAEIYPEIVNGGIESPEGQDFEIEAQEVPAVRDQMQAPIQFVIGLSNDMIGYVIPKSQWDELAPFTYGYDSAPYGEVNSLGPETGPVLHKALSDLLKESKQLQTTDQ